ncbi:MAG: hypothetical protein RIQ93_784, partial [Verrucomicrobiota bacterium]
MTRREFVQTGASAALAGSAASSLVAATAPRPKRGLIAAENAREGSRDWQLTRVRVDRDGFRSTWIEGYCSKQSVRAGESIDL